MREIAMKELVDAWKNAPKIPDNALYVPGETVRVGGLIMKMPPQPDPTCSPAGLASLFVGLRG